LIDLFVLNYSYEKRLWNISLKDIIVNLIKTANENDLFEKNAIELTARFFYTRFNNELKQYKYDPLRAFDDMNIRKQLYLFNMYIEEFMDLQRSMFQSMYPTYIVENPYNIILRKELRQIHHYLCTELWK